ncbi:MAG: dienelactone hydrolase family protein [Myxococcales bacterium]|nr:dienelactone hydrolase family protein [Myxococcales bacterium]MCB9749992.1 dienelactone hydrolase family protein [Myxococcales bacterium]
MSTPTTSRARAWIRRLLVSLALTYALICAALYLAQDSLIFHPTARADVIAALRRGEGARAVTLARGDATLEGVLLPARAPVTSATVLYFGGNAESVGDAAARLSWVQERGANLVVVPYRGYDGSTGSPSAEALRGDALAVYDHVAALPEVDPTRIFALGFSLGTGVATYLAHERALAGVILGAPFWRLTDIGQDAYPWAPVRPLMRHEFDSGALAPELQTPALIVHGAEDTLIPTRHGQRLRDAWGGPARFVEVPGAGHNDVMRQAAARAAIERFLFAEPARER